MCVCLDSRHTNYWWPFRFFFLWLKNKQEFILLNKWLSKFKEKKFFFFDDKNVSTTKYHSFSGVNNKRPTIKTHWSRLYIKKNNNNTGYRYREQVVHAYFFSHNLSLMKKKRQSNFFFKLKKNYRSVPLQMWINKWMDFKS